MTSFMVLLLTGTSGLAALLPQAASEPAGGQVRIEIVAVDRQGAPVMDLGPGDFEVWIEHFRAPIKTFDTVTPASENRGGRLIVLLLDDVTLSPAVVPRAREAAREFMNRLLPRDRMVVVTLSGTSTETTDDPVRLRRVIEEYNVRTMGVLRNDVLSEHVLEVIEQAARQLTEASTGRKTIVAIGSGGLFDRPLPPPPLGKDLEPKWTETMRALAFAHMYLYVIDPSGVGTGPADSGENGFARATGGRAFLHANDVKGAADRILRDASSYYVLGVSDPPAGRTLDLRELEVRVRRSGVTVLARRAIPGRP